MARSTGNKAPWGWRFGAPPQHCYLDTTTAYTGAVEVCFVYDETQFSQPENNLRLFHREGGWVEVTTSLDMTNNIICGEVNSFSEFAVLQPESAPIPTLSDFGLLLLSAILLLLIVFRVKHRYQNRPAYMTCLPAGSTFYRKASVPA